MGCDSEVSASKNNRTERPEVASVSFFTAFILGITKLHCKKRGEQQARVCLCSTSAEIHVHKGTG